MLFGLPLRQATGFVASLLKFAGLDWPVPDVSTLCRRRKTLAVQLPYRGSGGPLHLLIPFRDIACAIPCRAVDGTGIEVRGIGEWHARRHGGARTRVWRKVHPAMDEGEEDQERPRWGVSPTNREVRAVEITGSSVGPSGQIASQSPAGQWTRPCRLTCPAKSLWTNPSHPSLPPLGIMLRMTPRGAIPNRFLTLGIPVTAPVI